MRAVLGIAGAVVIVGIAVGVYTVKQRAPARPGVEFYQTPLGVNSVIQEQGTILSEAIGRKDLEYVHNQMYYVKGLADALADKLDPAGRQRHAPRLAEVRRVADEIDSFAGRGNLQATQASLKKLLDLFAALDADLKAGEQERK